MLEKLHQPFFLLILFAGCLLINKNATAQNTITKRNIAFISYPNFPEGHSTWDDIGYNATYDKVFVAVTNHRNKQALYAYDVKSEKMTLKGIVTDLAHLRTFHRQGKVHSKFIEGPDGNMFFSTDGGASREEYFMNHPRGYLGGFFMKWNPSTQKMTNLGMGLRFDSIKDVDVDPQTGILYGISYPQVHFLVYSPKTNDLKDLGRLGSAHVPRVLFTDRWGNCYYVDWRQRLVKYDKQKKGLIFAKQSLPAFDDTPGSAIITGITTYAKDSDKGIIYLITYGAKILAFHPKKDGIGRVKDLGGVIDTKDLGPGIASWRAYTPNLALGDNGKLYYFVGAEGRSAQKNRTLFIEFNPNTGKKHILFTYPRTEISGVTGSNTKDKNGNIYFAGRKIIKKDNHTQSIAFMIKFNPEKEIQQ